MIARFLGTLACVFVVACPAMAASNCSLTRVATFAASADSGEILIRVKIDDRDVSAILDTGSPFNLIDKALVEDLKLPTYRLEGLAIDAAGHAMNRMASAHTVTLGDFKTANTPFVVAGEVKGGRLSVLFGNAFLEAQDLELDLAHNKVSIFLSDHCAGQGVYWASEWVPIPITILKSGHILLPVTLDGFETHALLDTGASVSMIDKHVAEYRFDIPLDGGKDKADGHITAGSGSAIGFYKHTFKTLDIGGLQFHNVELAVAPNNFNMTMGGKNSGPDVTLRDEEIPDTPIVLGLRQMIKLRMYFSFQEHMLYVTPANAQ